MWSTAAILIGVVIGSGIYRVPSVVATEVGSVGGAALVWLLGAAVTLCGALTLAELSARFPRSGGAYVFLREAWGPLVAFLFGWVKLLVTGPSSLAAIALIFAAYAGSFAPVLEPHVKLVAAGLIVVLTVANIVSVAWTVTLQSVSTWAKVLGLAALAVLLFAFGERSAGALAAPIVWTPSSWGGFWVALIAVLWTYTGWVDLTYIAGEVKDPARTFPRAMAGGMAVVVVVYLLANAAFFHALPIDQVAQSDVVAVAAVERAFGAVGGAFVAVLVMVSTFGSLNGSILANPRVFYAMAQDGLFFRRVTAVHPRFQTPHVALVLYMSLGIVGVSTRTFEQLAEIFVLGIWPFYALAVGALLVVRGRRHGPEPAYRLSGYPLLPIVFLLVSIAMLLNGLIHRPAATAISVGVLLLGVPVYYVWCIVTRRALRPMEGTDLPP